MYEGTMLFRLQELATFVENYPINHSHLIRSIARLAAEEASRNLCGTSVLVGRYIEHLTVRDNYTTRTRKRIEGVLRRFCFVFGDLDPELICKPLVANWISKQGWAPSTQTWVALLIERCFVFGVKKAGVRWNQLDGLQSEVLKRLCGTDVPT